MNLLLCALIWSATAAKCPDTEGSDVQISISSASVTYDGCNYEEVTITLSGSIKAIPPNLFTNSNFKSLVIPDAVEEIQRNAFVDCKIDTIKTETSSSKLGKILDGAFKGLQPRLLSKAEFNLPNSVTEIGSSAFEGSNIKLIFDQEETKLSIIGNRAFFEASVSIDPYSDFYLTLPVKVTQIGNEAFKSSNIYSLTIPEDSSLGSIGDEAFAETNSFRSISGLHQAAGLTKIGNRAFYKTYSTLSFYLPESIETIGSEAFKYNADAQNYNSIYIASFANLQEIGNEAFEWQKLGLYEIDNDGNPLPNDECKFAFSSSLTDIGNSAFQAINNNGQITIDFSGATNLANIGDKAFYEISFSEDSILELNSEKIKLIGDNAFALNNYLERTFNIKSLNNLEKIGDDPFKYQIVNYPDNIDFPATLYYIGNNAFIRQPKSSGQDEQEYYSNSISSISFKQTNPIEKIGDHAFENQDNLVVSSTIKANEIGEYAFAKCAKLNTNIEIEPTGKVAGSIGDYAFYNCISLEGTLTMKNPEDPGNKNPSLSSIKEASFQNTNLKKINLPHMKSVGVNAFQNCFHLETDSKDLEIDTIFDSAFKDCTSLVLTSITAKSISGSAFENCHKLGADIVILDGGNIGPSAFYCCDKLGSLTYDRTFIKDNLKVTPQNIGQEAFRHSGVKGALTIPFFINKINKYAFANCDDLTGLEIESNLEIKQSIEDNAFYYSKIGKNLIIPKSVAYIGEKAFAFTDIQSVDILGSNYIEKITDDYGNTKLVPIGIHIDSDAFYYCNKLEQVTLGVGYIDFESTTFKGCPIKTLDLGQIEKIPDEAFYGVTTLTKVSIPDNVTEIGTRAFAECTKIDTISFTEDSHLTTIKSEAFYRCEQLATTKIPKGVTQINSKTYYKCFNLPLISIPSEVTLIDEFAFYQCGKFSGNLILPAEIETIGESAFEGTAINGELLLPESLETIDKNAFNGCSSLTGSLAFGRSIEKIGESAFRDCIGFNGNLKFPEKLNNNNGNRLTIDNYAFCGCAGFTGDLALPQDVTVNKYAFRDCTGFNGELNLPSTLKTISEGVFYNCNGFIGEIPLRDVTTVSKYAFYNCQGFTGSLDFDQISTVNEYAFYNCKGLDGELIKPAGLTNVKQYAFYGCSGLKGVLVTDNFQEIDKYAFYGCSGLTGSLHFKDTLKWIEEYAFAGCSGFSEHLSFKIKGTGNLIIEQRAFKDCTGFKNGRLTFTITELEEKYVKNNAEAHYYYRYDYFLRIGNEAFEKTKFKDIYYLGRFEPDCDYDIGISKIKGIHTSSNYANKTFCNYPLHSNKLSGGVIAGIVIACIIVVAAIVVLIVWLIIRNKRNKDNSEAEVEMNQDP